MAEMRKSGGGTRRTAGRTARQNGGRRTAQSRKLANRPGSIPRPVMIGLIVGPALGIVVLLAISMLKGSGSEEPPPVNPNTVISDLRQQIPELQKEYGRVMQLLRSEDPRGKAEFEKLSDRMYSWIKTWDTLFDESRDADGNLPPELQAYRRTRSEVNQLLSDLNKSAPF